MTTRLAGKMAQTAYDFTVQDIYRKDVPLRELIQKVVHDAATRSYQLRREVLRDRTGEPL